MDTNTFLMRVTAAKLVDDVEFRSENCKRGMSAAVALGPEGRSRRIWQLAWATRTAFGAIAALLTYLFGEHGPGFALRKRMARVVPWPIQKAFLRFVE